MPGSKLTNSGFSLVELFVVITIIAVLATIGTPWLLAMKTKSSIRADARDVHSTFRQAQSIAVKRGDIACVVIDDNTGTYQIDIQDYLGTTSDRKRLRPGNAFSLATADYFATDPCFNFRGLPTTPVSGSLLITRSRNVADPDDALLTMEVHMSASGHVKSEAKNWK